MTKKILLVLIVIACCLTGGGAQAQKKLTSIAGTVTDQSNGEAMAFVQVIVPGSTMGTVTDINGRFDLTVGAADSLVCFRMVGYKPIQINFKVKRAHHLKVEMEPTDYTLQEVSITAKRTKGERYRRKDNPAVELAQQVIAHKEQNDVMQGERFSREVYEKLNMCVDQFHPNFETHRLWKHLPFVEKYIDKAEFDGADILHFSIAESMMQQDCEHGRLRTLTKAERHEGVGVKFEDEGLDADLKVLFAPADIFSNEIDMMSVRFVSPLSSTLGNAFYHYYITDTLEEDGQRLIELSFIPATKGNFGFVGSMYIVDDGSYALKRYSMRVPEMVDLNFVRDLSILQTFENDHAGHWLPMKTDVYCRIYASKRLQVYAHQMRRCHDYAFDSAMVALPDSIFKPMVVNARVPGANKVRRRVWNAERPVELTMAETFLDSFRYELMRVPLIRHMIHVGEILGTGYLPTSADRDSSRFDIGSIYNMVSHNGLEGLRIRLGGMTTYKLSNRNFFNGYAAYGFDDRRPKFDLSYIHTFEPKRRYPMEPPLGYIGLNLGYEVVSPGLSFDQFSRDNILMWTNREVPAQYVADIQLRLRRQWPSNIGIDTWIGAQHMEPTGMLDYYRVTSSGTERVDGFHHFQWCGKASFSPNAVLSAGRSGEGSLLSVANSTTTFTLGHEAGWLDGFFYNRTTASAYRRVWLSAFGYMDLRLKGGMLWNSVPMPMLFIPNGNASIWQSDQAFSTMKPMEYIADRYVQLFATYHMKGLILNHIPLVNRLRLREVVGFNMLYGGLSSKNDPQLHEGLYLLPQNANFLGSQPYAEVSIGLENILKVIRVDFVRRLTYLDGIDQPWTIKVGARFAM